MDTPTRSVKNKMDGCNSLFLFAFSNDNTFGTKQMFYLKIAYKYLRRVERCLNSGPLELKYKKFINNGFLYFFMHYWPSI